MMPINFDLSIVVSVIPVHSITSTGNSPFEQALCPTFRLTIRTFHSQKSQFCISRAMFRIDSVPQLRHTIPFKTGLYMRILVFMVLSSIVARSLRVSRAGFMSKMERSLATRTLREFSAPENSLQKYLTKEDAPLVDGSQIRPRTVKAAHFTCVLPEKVAHPYLVAVSKACMLSLNIDPTEAEKPNFVQVFSGNELMPGMDKPYCTVYGCHSFGQWFGQLGDGRAIYLGETHVADIDDETSDLSRSFYSLGLRELQLKGSGRSPYSRGFDGRAVLRSSVREFLVSEAMHHLNVRTTRALSLIGTNQAVSRPWYASTSQENPYANDPTGGQKFPPDVRIREPGAIVCRVSRSFLRFGHLELFGRRQEYKELVQMADYMCLREYPHLLDITVAHPDGIPSTFPRDHLPDTLPSPGPASRYVALLMHISQRVADLVVEWMRVGYVQGNMNSDNTLISGTTMDYGPYGWMEAFNPYYQPFTSDSVGNFCFIRQPVAMAVNVQTLFESAFEPLVKHICQTQGDPNLADYLSEMKAISDAQFIEYFERQYGAMKARKLGLSEYQTETDDALWNSLLQLLTQSQADYTIFFRELCNVPTEMNSINEALNMLSVAFYNDEPGSAEVR